METFPLNHISRALQQNSYSTWLSVFGPYRRLLTAITGCTAFRMLVTDGDSMFNMNPAMARLAWKTASVSKGG